jgi:hypothetical protein
MATNSTSTDWEVGAWYHNPMMEEKGTTRARYVRIGSFDMEKFDTCTSFSFDMYIMPDGTVCSNPLTQSNGKYEDRMVRMKDIEAVHLKMLKEQKRKRLGL